MRPRQWLTAVMAECAGGGRSVDSGHYVARRRFPRHVLDVACRLLTAARAGAAGIDGGDGVQWRRRWRARREAVAGAARAVELRRARGRGTEVGRGRSEGAEKGRGSRARASDVAGATRARPARGHGGVRRGVWWTHRGRGGRGGRTAAHPRCRGTPARLGGAAVEEEVEDDAVMRTRRRGDVGMRWRGAAMTRRRGSGRRGVEPPIQLGSRGRAPVWQARRSRLRGGVGNGHRCQGARQRGMGSSPIQIQASVGGDEGESGVRGGEWG